MSILTRLRTAAARLRSFTWRSPAAVTASILAAAGHVWVLFNVPISAGAAIWVLPLLVIAPGLVTLILLGGWRRWYRWAGILALTGTTDPEYLPYVLIAVEAWALHRHWAVERSIPLRDLFSLRRTVTTPEPGTTEPGTAAPAKTVSTKRRKAPKTA